MSSSGRNCVGLLADPAADHEQLGGEQLLQGPVVRREPLGPLLPGQVLGLADAVGGPLLGVVAVDLEVAELGVRHQDAVVHQRRADAGAERGDDDQPLRPLAAPYRTSARPAASASLTTCTSRRSASVNRASASVPIHAWSMLAAEWTTPCWTTPGTVTPTGPGVGEPGEQLDEHLGHRVGRGGARGRRSAPARRRSRRRSRSTGAPLMPVPPKSMPNGRSLTPSPSCAQSPRSGTASRNLADVRPLSTWFTNPMVVVNPLGRQEGDPDGRAIANSTVPPGSTERWRDRKRYLWLIGLVVPVLAFIGYGCGR